MRSDWKVACLVWAAGEGVVWLVVVWYVRMPHCESLLLSDIIGLSVVVSAAAGHEFD